MTAIVELTPRDSSGYEVLNAFEALTHERANQVDPQTGARRYCLWGAELDLGALDRVLDDIARDWREHLRRG
jgi:hypothetical protein